MAKPLHVQYSSSYTWDYRGGVAWWTIKAADSKRLNAFEMVMYRKVMRIRWREHRTNNSILEELQPTCRFLAEVKRRKLQYFGHVVRAGNICTHILHGIIAGNRRRGRPRRRWTDDIKQWILLQIVFNVQETEACGDPWCPCR